MSSLALIVLANGLVAPDPMTVMREATRVTAPHCGTHRNDDIVVCGRRQADKYRLPIVGPAAGTNVPAERAALVREATACEARGPFLIGCGMAGVSVSVGLGRGGQVRLRNPSD